MGENEAAEQVVTDPTWLTNIRFFFRQKDIDHMAVHGYNLASYAAVKKHALEIHFQVTPPAQMPPPPDTPWSTEKVQTFNNWIANGCPLGFATAQPAGARAAVAAPDRLRKNIATLGDDEIEKLKTAFSGLMARDADPTDENSYFAIAGAHGLPGAWCAHHDDPFNPWHRTFLRIFEDQLRTIPGCEDVTLPYWDITTELPPVLSEAPFGSYELPRDPGATSDPPEPGTWFPYTTNRVPPAQIMQNMGPPPGNDVYADVDTSLQQSLWGTYNSGGYQKFSMQAHDGGHDSIGETMQHQDVAAYDPVFWFFHCNLDRLWLSWQTLVGATTLSGFESTITGDSSWLAPPFNGLPPFQTTADQTIAFGIAYDELAPVSEEAPLENKAGSLEAGRSFSIKSSAPVSVRVKDIDRLNIPGPFVVKLLADGEPIAQRAFFQPRQPRNCENCRKTGLVNIDFRIDHDKLLDRTLSVAIEMRGRDEVGARFPLSQAGNPTINARLLLDDE
jgi:hypothetical protein